ncbi:YoaK family protein [Nocardia spumae]|uniref:YoaK family protein n=1 Tax=Nocardia spumae TaxID=2887190 RepID=UPI001D149B50|nr:YoaK family protein [Nocardia spumae]
MSLDQPHRLLVLGYGSLLAAVAGFVNAVAILVLAFPVGNLTATTTKLGMDVADPMLHEGSVLAFIILGFLIGAMIAGAALSPADRHAGARHSAVMSFEAFLLISAFMLTDNTVAVILAAIACGMQNGTTSSLRAMQIRTTHFTGTLTDLGLLIGRSPQYGFDAWKGIVLSATVVTFIGGGVAGTVAGSRIGDAALLIPAGICIAVAVVGLGYDLWRTAYIRANQPTPSPRIGHADTEIGDDLVAVRHHAG